MTTAATALRDIAIEVRGGSRVLAAHGLEYFTEGEVSLSEACARAGVPVEAVLRDLADVAADAASAQSDERWLRAPLGELMKELTRVHHEFARVELRRLARLVEAARAREAEHPELARVQELLAGFEEELEPHMALEERDIFPLILALERASRGEAAAPELPTDKIDALLVHEHLSQVEVLRELRRLTFGFKAPDAASLPLRLLYQGLEQLEADLVRHLHLENNVLFPRARVLVRRARA